MSFQQCEFNFGAKPYRYPPPLPFKSFNQYGELSPEEKIILPRQQKMAMVNQFVVSEDACILCFDKTADTQLLYCGHRGFCKDCTIQLETCPICRKDIAERVTVSADHKTPTPPMSLIANPVV